MSNVIDWPKQEDDDGIGRREVRLYPGQENETCEVIEKAMLQRNLPIFVNAGRIVTVINGDSLDYDPGQEAKSVRLIEVGKARLMWHMGEACYFQKWNATKKKLADASTPENLALLILGRVGLWPFPEVIGVVSAQSIDAQGTVIDQEGVHKTSGLLFYGLPKLPPIPERPTKADALAALERLKDLIAEFPFVDEVSRSVAIAALISPLLGALSPKTPTTAVDAPSPGSGKSYFCRLVAAIAIGRAPANLPRTENVEEFEKRLVGALLQGPPVLVIDNVNGVLRSDLLAQAISETEIDLRRLGLSDPIKTRVRSNFLINGNNLVTADDLNRRILRMALDHNEERPELHEYKLHPRPLERIMTGRGEFIADALTIIKAYIAAERPGRRPQLASFEEWSDNVRSALVWLGLEDPCKSMETVRENDPVGQKLQALTDAWPKLETEYALKELIELAAPGTTLNDVLMGIASAKGGIDIDKTRLGNWISSNAKDRVRTRDKTKVKFVTESKERSGARRWKLTKVTKPQEEFT